MRNRYDSERAIREVNHFTERRRKLMIQTGVAAALIAPIPIREMVNPSEYWPHMGVDPYLEVMGG